MSGIEHAARAVVSSTDILRLHRGATWKDMYSRQSFGGCGPRPWVTNCGTWIEVHDAIGEPGERVDWSEIETVIRAGTTIGDLAALAHAYRLYCLDGGRYGPDTTDVMRAVTADVVARGLAALEPAVEQLDLFAGSPL